MRAWRFHRARVKGLASARGHGLTALQRISRSGRSKPPTKIYPHELRSSLRASLLKIRSWSGRVNTQKSPGLDFEPGPFICAENTGAFQRQDQEANLCRA